MKRVMKNIAIVLTLLLCVSFIFTNAKVYAESLNIPITSVLGVSSAGGAESSVKSIMGGAVIVAQVIAAGVAVIMLLVLAMKYMSAAPGEKAEIKKHAVIYVVGAIVMFGVTGILEIIKKFSNAI